MLITVVIPAYNEERDISIILEDIEAYLSKNTSQHNIIVVDDGSVDNTAKIVNSLITKYPQISFFQLGKNYGKGKAVREGMLRSTGDYILFMDADGSTSIQELEKILPAIKQNKEVIIGTRKIKEAEIIEHQPFFREFLGKGFTALSNFVTQAHVSDFTCGFKCFSKKAARDIFSRAVINDWSFDAEILHIAKKLGYTITEIPVRWKNDRNTKVRLMRDVLNSFKGLLRIKIYSIRGMYE